jgi:hypothetical protein
MEGKPLPQPTNVAVRWQEAMEFDGREVGFGGDVEVDTRDGGRRPDWQWARANRLVVTLAQRVDFADAKAQQKPEVAAIEFDGKFAMENRSIDKVGQLSSIERMECERLKYERGSREFFATGPGWVSTVRKEGASNPLAGRGLLPAIAKPASNGKSGFNYLLVRFQGGIAGSDFHKSAEFQRHVQAIYGPVANWDGTLSTVRPDQLPPEAVLLECQKLALAEMPTGISGITTLEMVATGDTIAEGRGFTARAARIAYVDEKQQLILEGDGRRDAELTRQQRLGGEPSFMKAQKITYWHKDDRADVHNADRIEFNQLEGLKLPMLE